MPRGVQLYTLYPLLYSVKKLPRKGFTKITVSDGLKKLLRHVAEAEGLSMPGLILKMVEKQYQVTLQGLVDTEEKEEPSHGA